MGLDPGTPGSRPGLKVALGRRATRGRPYLSLSDSFPPSSWSLGFPASGRLATRGHPCCQLSAAGRGGRCCDNYSAAQPGPGRSPFPGDSPCARIPRLRWAEVAQHTVRGWVRAPRPSESPARLAPGGRCRPPPLGPRGRGRPRERRRVARGPSRRHLSVGPPFPAHCVPSRCPAGPSRRPAGPSRSQQVPASRHPAGRSRSQ